MNTEAEVAVLGSVLINPDVMEDIRDTVSSDDFVTRGTNHIWDAITWLYDNRHTIDLLMVGNVLEAEGKLEEIGGRAFLTSLINNVPSSIHAKSYAKILRDS